YYITVRKLRRKHTPRSIRERPFTGSAQQHSSSTTTKLPFSSTTPRCLRTSTSVPTRSPTPRLRFVSSKLRVRNPNKLRAPLSRRRKKGLNSRSAITTVSPVGLGPSPHFSLVRSGAVFCGALCHLVVGLSGPWQ